VNRDKDRDEFLEPVKLRDQLVSHEADITTPQRHDDAVIAAMRRLTAERKPLRPSRWRLPASLAASFIAGALLVGVPMRPHEPAAGPALRDGLTMPLAAQRGGDARNVPVEAADPARWYRYIEDLLASGRRTEALQHLRRFNELHPEYVHQP
jgi:hypothetical protein